MWDDAGVRQVFGSDYPARTLSVLKGIEAAVTRMTESGDPPGGWYPEGPIHVDAALHHYTSDTAWGTHDERETGTPEIGKFADFGVVSENLLEIDPALISEVEVLQTVMHGKTTYAAQPGQQDQPGTRARPQDRAATTCRKLPTPCRYSHDGRQTLSQAVLNAPQRAALPLAAFRSNRG